MQGLQQLSTAIIDGDAGRTQELVQAAIDQHVSPEEIVNEWMVPAMVEVGIRFERQVYFVPEMLISARAMRTGLALLRPLLAKLAVKPVATVVIGTVKGDLHDIGKNLVAIMLEGAGFTVVDLGVDVSPEHFVNCVEENHPDIVALSALLTTTMSSMKATIDALQHAGLRRRVKVMVGGAPLTESFACAIGADGYAPDASAAVRKALELVTVPAEE